MAGARQQRPACSEQVFGLGAQNRCPPPISAPRLMSRKTYLLLFWGPRHLCFGGFGVSFSLKTFEKAEVFRKKRKHNSFFLRFEVVA